LKGFIRIEPGSDLKERKVSIIEQAQDALMAAIPSWEEARAHIENGLGGDRLDSLLKDLSTGYLPFLARRRLIFFG